MLYFGVTVAVEFAQRRARRAVHFRTAIRRRRDETHLVERLFLRPVGAAMSSVARLLAEMHHGRLNAYVGYVVSFLILILFLYRLS